MRKSDAALLVSVSGVAALFAAMSLSEAARVLPARPRGAAAAPGSAGMAREVDAELLLERLRRRELSEHEADFYTRLPRTAESAAPAPPSQPAPGGSPPQSQPGSAPQERETKQ